MKIIFDDLDKFDKLINVLKLNRERVVFNDCYTCVQNSKCYFFMQIRSLSQISLLLTRINLYKNFNKNLICVIYCDDDDIIEIIKNKYSEV